MIPSKRSAKGWRELKGPGAAQVRRCVVVAKLQEEVGEPWSLSMTDSCKLRANLATRFYDVVDQQIMETEKAYEPIIKFLEDELGEDTLYHS